MTAVMSNKEGVLKVASLALAATGSLALTWSSTPAEAQGRAGFAPMADPFNSFSIGLGGGVDIFRTQVDAFANGYNSFNYGGPLRKAGGFGSIEIGKDFRFDRLVLGVYGEYNFGRKSDAISTTTTDYYNTTGTASLKLRNSHAVLGRLGVIYSPQTLIYGIFGYTWQKYDATVNVVDGLFGTDSATRSGTLGGLTFGIGGEWLVNSNLSLKAEYRLVKLDAPASPYFCCGPEGGATFDKVEDHVFRGVISYKLPGL